MSDPLWIDSGKASTAVGTATIATDGTFTIADHGLNDGETVVLDSLSGGASAALVEDAVYYVRDSTTNTFTLSLTLHGPVVTLASSGGADVYTWAPGYSSEELRRAGAVRLYAGVSSEFGARAGVRPHDTDPISVSGTTWTVHDLTAVVNGAGSGAYEVGHPEESGSLDPADGSNDRIDALDLQIQDDGSDASGQRRARVVYTAGQPASEPSAEPVVSNAVRLGTILVPSGGSPSPSVASLGDMTVASGGILPVRDDESFPSDGVREGAYADRDEALWRLTDGDWVPAASPNSPTVEYFTSSDNFTKADYPWARRVRVRVQGGGGGGAGNNDSSENAGGGGAGGWYAESWIDVGDLSASETVTVGSGGSGGAHDSNGSGGDGSSFGSHVVASGGQAGFASGTAGNATAGSGTGDLVVGGGAGGAGGASSSGGTGGASHLGGGGLGGRVNSSQSGGDAVGFGGGGGGGAGGSASNAGGDGSDGVVIVEVW